MKIPVLAATLVLAGAAAALAGPIRAGEAVQADAAAPPAHADVPAALGVCELRADGATLEAYAAPVNAVSWSLDVRAPGFAAGQSGPLSGDQLEPEQVSRITLVRDPGRGASPPRSGPVHAELVLYDEAGEVVCADRIIRGPRRL
jgi:hypothetical protein